jgi:hypothetical protein
MGGDGGVCRRFPGIETLELNGGLLRKIPDIDYRIHPLYGKVLGQPTLLNRYRAIRRFFPRFLKVILKKFLLHFKYYSLSIDYDLDNEMEFDLKHLVQNGAMATRLTSEEKALIQNLLNNHVDILREKRSKVPANKRSFSDISLWIYEHQAPQLYSQILQLLENHNLVNVISTYVGTSIKLSIIRLVTYDEMDEFMYTPFSRNDAPKTVDMHIDPPLQNTHQVCIKGILYLNEVTVDNGPFSYILGSNNYKIGFLERVIRESNALCGLCDYKQYNRELFFALPKSFQKKASIGTDLLDSSPESSILINLEHQFTSKDGDLILFDFQGIHRGGLRCKGERQSIELIFSPKTTK